MPTLARLPLDIRDPRERLRAVAETTQSLKASKEVHAIELFEDMANWADAPLLSALVRRATRWWAGNLIVTDVPGPQLPLYLLGARLLEGYPFVPMMANQALGSPCSATTVGSTGASTPTGTPIADLHDLVECFVDEFAELTKAAAEPRPVRKQGR